jgi:hypothetical protein
MVMPIAARVRRRSTPARTRWRRRAGCRPAASGPRLDPPGGGFPGLGQGLVLPPSSVRRPDPAAWPGRAGMRRAGLRPAAAASAGAYIDSVKPPCHLPISTCIGCGAMRQYESCAGACSERERELVSGGDYDELTAAAAACRVRIQGLWAVIEELARREPGPDEWQIAYEALQQSARSVLRRSWPGSGGRDDPLSSAETVTVWRCQDCGGVDAPQPCIDVCIWRPADWVDATSYESERSRAAFDREVEQSLAGLLRRLAFATPRDGQWKRSWRAFQSQARLAALRTRSRPPGRLDAS